MFVTQGPVDPESRLFAGRTAELKKMEAWLTHVSCVGAVLGARQTGKTSLLLKLRHNCREKYAAAFVDLQAIEGASIGECFRYIAGELCGQLLGTDTVPGSDLPEDGQAFLSHLRKLAAPVQPIRIIVILDEIGALPPETALKLCSTIRAIFTSRLIKPEFGRFIFLLAGATDMLELTKGKNSPLKNVTESIYLGDLSLAETNQLLAAALNDLGVRPDPVLSERLHLWTSGHPYWTQLLASNLESPAKTPTERLLRELINHLLETEDRNLPHVFGSLEREGERLGSLIVSLLDGKPVSFSRSHAPVAKLELIGILKNNQGRCAFRNQIYQEAMQRHFERAALPRLGRIGAQNETSPANKSTIDLSGGLRTGTLLKGRYLVEGELGRGGQGVTYLARDQQLYSRPVVVKVLVERSDPQFWRQARFREEIEALALIDNPGVVGVFDADALPDGRPFLVMQFVEGATLRFRLKERGMDLKEVAGISRQVGQALNAAHNKGVWHCDLKPENIMVQILSEGNEAVKLIDFGLARVRDSHLDGGSGGRGLAGTIPYMAPEQLEQKPPSALTDIYSFGVIVFEMLTGRRPFHANSLDQLLALQRSGAVALCRDVPETARKLILQALSFNPQQRPSHARDFCNLMATALISHPSARKKSTTG